jgi:hypothetical protein
MPCDHWALVESRYSCDAAGWSVYRFHFQSLAPHPFHHHLLKVPFSVSPRHPMVALWSIGEITITPSQNDVSDLQKSSPLMSWLPLANSSYRIAR